MDKAELDRRRKAAEEQKDRSKPNVRKPAKVEQTK